MPKVTRIREARWITIASPCPYRRGNRPEEIIVPNLLGKEFVMKRILAFTLMLAFMLATLGIARAAERTEIVSKRTEYAKVFDNGNGTYTAEIKNHPIHKKNSKGDWVDMSMFENGAAKTAESVYNYDTYSVYYGSSSYETGIYKSAVGTEYSTKKIAVEKSAKTLIIREWRSAYLFYLAGIEAEYTTDAYYEIENPECSLGDTLYVTRCADNPRWTAPATIFAECGNPAVYGKYMYSDDPIAVNYGSAMVSDILDAVNDGYITYGHQSPLYYLSPNFIGTNATLYLTLSRLAPFMAKEVSSIFVSPNPFNPKTTIKFTLQENADVAIIFIISVIRKYRR